MTVVQVAIRRSTRKIPRRRRAVLAGKEVHMRDRPGNGFVFRATADTPVSLAEAVGGLLGSVQTGRRKKSLAGYGRD